MAPHPDDEVLGAGGTLLRRKAEGARTAWLIVTTISRDGGWSDDRIERRRQEIERVRETMQFDEVHELKYPTTKLDQVPMGDLVSAIGDVFRAFEPSEVFVPHFGDVHSDHDAVFTAAASCVKWFRYPSVKRALAYETLSETDFGLRRASAFRPNVFVDIGPYVERKLEAMSIYASELSDFPFPRSIDAMQALAKIRGAASGYSAAEAFELLVDRS